MKSQLLIACITFISALAGAQAPDTKDCFNGPNLKGRDDLSKLFGKGKNESFAKKFQEICDQNKSKLLCRVEKVTVSVADGQSREWTDKNHCAEVYKSYAGDEVTLYLMADRKFEKK